MHRFFLSSVSIGIGLSVALKGFTDVTTYSLFDIANLQESNVQGLKYDIDAIHSDGFSSSDMNELDLEAFSSLGIDEFDT